jgi:DNA-binding transcriptional LysR family regulator
VVRKRSGCELTAEGRRFVEYAEAIVRLVSRAQNLVGRREVVVGASSNIGTYLLPPLLRAFEDRHPEVAVSLTIGDNEKIARQLDTGLADVALMEWWVDAPGFTASVWRNEPLVVIVHPGHPWSGRRTIPTDWLLNEKVLGGERGTGTGALLRKQLGARASALQVVRQLGSTAAVKEAVKNRLGISLVMAASVRDEVAAGSLHMVEIEDAVITKPLYCVSGRGADLRSAAAVFARFVNETLAVALLPAAGFPNPPRTVAPDEPSAQSFPAVEANPSTGNRGSKRRLARKEHVDTIGR